MWSATQRRLLLRSLHCTRISTNIVKFPEIFLNNNLQCPGPNSQLLPASELASLITNLHGSKRKTTCIVEDACLPTRCLAMDFQFCCYSVFHAVFTEALSINGLIRHNIKILSVTWLLFQAPRLIPT
jgi:hypothetical protein